MSSATTEIALTSTSPGRSSRRGGGMSFPHFLSWQRVTDTDARALAFVQRLHCPALTRCMRAVTHVGDAASWILIAALLLSLGGEGAQVGYKLAASALAATIVSQVLKRMLRRPRPSTAAGCIALVENPDAFSFPSGHTAAAFAVAVALAPTGAGPVLFALACTVALSRVYLGVHYPLDVGVGAVIGSASGALLLSVL